MDKKRSCCLSAVFVIILLLASACGSNKTTEQTTAQSTNDTEKKILRIAYNREIDVLNPYTSQNLVDIEFSMIEGLITTDDNNTYIPVLAKEIPTVENGLIVYNKDGTISMTWRLRENVFWHDGEEFTAKMYASPGNLLAAKTL